MFKNRWAKRCLVLFILYFLCLYVFPLDAFARVGGGRSSGSRGSRSSTPPRSYSPPRSTQPSPPPSQSLSQPSPQPQSSLWRGVMGGIMGGIIGGMLFRSLGFGGNLGTEEGGGIGLFEILLIGALLFGVYWYFKKRRQAALANAYYQSSMGTAEPSYQTSYGQSYEPPREEDRDLGKGLSFIRQMDSSFDEKKFQDLCMDHFFKIQGAWANRDMSGAKNLLTEEMSGMIQGDAEKLKSERKMNRLENIAVRSVEMLEAWQESGRDYITVRFYANLLDYTVDESTGQVVSGSKTEPVKFEEYWTFTRPVGNNSWKLSAINQAE
jgi:predicted lipid-binding transport protein (Tim44 family)